MLKKIKSKYAKVLVPLSIMLFNTNLVLAEDDITRKMENGKKWIIGIMTGLAIINVVVAVYSAGSARVASEIESTEKWRRNAFIALGIILVVDVIIALYKTW